MKWFTLCLVFVFTTLFSLDEAYFQYLEKHPTLSSCMGNAEQGEIEIILDKQKMLEIQQKMGRKVGVVSEDNYWLWINDAVKFPSGKYGIYARLLVRQSLQGTPGVAVLPILPNGKIALNRNFRHATRSWEYELPRGGLNIGESIEEAAAREVREETGMILDKLQLLGHMAVDSGLTNAVIPVFFAKTIGQEDAQPEDSEAIASIDSFSVKELKQGFIDGYLTTEIDGKVHQIPLRDPFLSFALFQAEIRGLFL